MSNRETKVDLLYQKYYCYLVVCAQRMIGKSSMAEDFVQDTFYRLLNDNNLDKIEDINSSRTRNFILKILTNIIISSKKCEKNELIFNEDLFYTRKMVFDPTWSEYSCHDLRDQLKSIVIRLPLRDQIFLYYRYGMGLSFYEISELMGVSEKYATTRLSRLTHKIHALLGEGIGSREKR